MPGICECGVQMCVCQLLLKSLRLPDHKRGLAKLPAQCQSIRFELPYAQLCKLRLPTYHAGKGCNFRHISCEDLEAPSLTIMESARVRRQELQEKNVPVPQLQAPKVLAQAGQLAFAPPTVRSDTQRPVAVGPAGEVLHNRLQVSNKTSHTVLGRVGLRSSAVVSNCDSRCIKLQNEAAAAAPAEQTTVSLSAQAQRLACLAKWWPAAAKSNKQDWQFQQCSLCQARSLSEC